MSNTKRFLILLFLLFIGSTIGFFGYQYYNKIANKQPISLEDQNAIQAYIENLEFTGSWKNSVTGSEILNSGSGKATLKVHTPDSYAKFVNKNKVAIHKWRSSIILEDPLYYDLNLVQILQSVNIRTDEDGTLGFETTKNTGMYIYDTYQDYHLKQIGAISCNYNGTITFNPNIFENKVFNITKLKELNNAVYLNFTAQNEDCKLQISATMEVNNYNTTLQQILYSMLFVLIGLINWYGAIKILSSINESVNYTSKLNLWTLMGVSVQDSFIFILHLNFAIGFIDSTSLFMIFFIYFFLFVLIDYRIVLFVWRYHTFRVFDNLQDLQYSRKLYYFQIKFYGFLVLYNYLMWRFFMNEWLIFANSFILLPQIIHNISHPSAPEFDPNYLIFYSSIKYLIFYYIRGYSHNIFHIQHFYLITTIGFAIILLCLLVLFCQEGMGASFIVPRLLQQKQYEYLIDVKVYRRLKEEEVSKSDESFFKDDACSICLDDLFDKNFKIKQKDADKRLKIKLYRKKLQQAKDDKLMRAPCQHVFHPYCLLQWMEVKMECPCCRNELPAIN